LHSGAGMVGNSIVAEGTATRRRTGWTEAGGRDDSGETKGASGAEGTQPGGQRRWEPARVGCALISHPPEQRRTVVWDREVGSSTTVTFHTVRRRNEPYRSTGGWVVS
ncbi:MAG: hypothetical protein M3137_19470, partial [Actinomycetota bacterium]|nr:hypothetical protein [Actinomycetota bacterium]